MHVWYVDKKNGAEFEELPAIRFVWFCQFHCFLSRICHLFEQNPAVPSFIPFSRHFQTALEHFHSTAAATDLWMALQRELSYLPVH